MGEVAEMMLDGTLCEGCGVYLDGNGEGFPRHCHDCKRERGSGGHMRTKVVAKVKCPTCGKLVKKAGLSDHQRDVHGAAANAETFVADVRRFTEAVGCTTDRFNVRQTALYIGLQLEEMAEKLEAISDSKKIDQIDALKEAEVGGAAVMLRDMSRRFKEGDYDDHVEAGDREAMLDADVDLAWVTVGSALSQGADLLGAMREVARANLDKIGPDGAVLKDENGKVKKPDGWRGPDIAPYVLREVAK